MKIAVLKEQASGERRVSASPETVKKFIGLGATVAVETGAGEYASISDADFAAAGAMEQDKWRQRSVAGFDGTELHIVKQPMDVTTACHLRFVAQLTPPLRLMGSACQHPTLS